MDVELRPDSNFQYGIEGVAFRFYSSEEVKALSVKEITKPDTFDTLSQPTIGGLYDPALGPSDPNDACFTCGQGMVHCPGHLGHIELPMTTFNPVFFDIMFKMLKATCFNCHRVMVQPLKAHIFICQCRLLAKGHVTAVAKLNEMCGDTEPTATGENELDKWDIITKYTEEALKEVDESVVLVKNVEGLRQEIKNAFIAHDLTKTGKCPHCIMPIKTLRQEYKSKITIVGKIADNKLSNKYKRVEKVNLESPDGSDEEEMGEEVSEPAAKRRKLQDFQKASSKASLKTGNKTTEVTLLTAVMVKAHLHKVWEKDGLLLQNLFPAMASSTSPTPVDVFLLDVIAVPASRFRPIAKLGDRKYENAQTVNFAKVLKDTVVIRELLWEIEKRTADTEEAMQPLPIVLSSMPGKTLIDKLHVSLVQMQSHVNALIDSDLDKLSRDANPGIKQLLEKKQGLFRKNMMGKRVNYAARSVISPDPNINTDEIGIPMVFAKVLTYPQPVTPWNVMELKQAVMNGPNTYPGATCIINEDGSRMLVDSRNPQQREALAKQLLTPSIKRGHYLHSTSKVVYRHLKNGDVLLLNRQPSLHRPSIQGHKARVLKGEKTLRLHYSNCKAYNADFDGDEMNAHLPQNELARSEGYNLALTDTQYLVPKDGTPLAGLIQDHMVSGVSLTIRGRYFNKADYCRLVYTALIDKPGPIRLLSPSILKPYRLWSGKQVLSTVVLNVIPAHRKPLSMIGNAKVPEKSWIKVAPSNPSVPVPKYMGESDVIIRHGELLVGILDKGHYGPTPYGLIHCCYELYGGATAGKLLACFGRLFMNFLQWRGFSLGVKDILVTKRADRIRSSIVEESPNSGLTAVQKALELGNTTDEDKIKTALKKAHYSKDQRSTIELDMGFRTQTNNIQNDIVNACMPSGLVKLFPDNNLQLMVVSGAKGSSVNCMQISCLLGQIELEGKRPPLMMSGKTLPSFLNYDITPRAGGFVTGRFLTGIRQQEYFFHCMAGREGLIDTAVKTSRSGYLQRCLIKHLEGIKVNYDLTVRDSDNSIIQFQYGEDSLDILKTAYLDEKQYPFLSENHGVIQADPYPRDHVGKKVKKMEKKINKWQQKNTPEGDESRARCSGFLKFFQQVGNNVAAKQPLDPKYEKVKGRSLQDVTLCQMWYELKEKERQKYKKKYSRCPDPVQSQYSPYTFEALPEKLSEIASGFAKKPNKSETSQLSGAEFLDLLRLKAKRSMVEPGESVGLLCSQSIGEPSTQMTLNTFHFAGRGEMNVTLGIPRLREILMVGSRNIMTPAMDIPIRNGAENKSKAKQLQKLFTPVHLDKKYVWVKQLSGVPKGVMWPAKVISQSASADFVDIYIKSDNAEMEKYLHRSREVDDVEQSLLGELTTTEKYLMKSQELMWIRGKRGKRVPVLIPNDTSKALTYITDKEVRKIGGVKSTNQYMFATKGDGIIRASECIKQLGNENANELIHPDRLTSTGYRAYMATIAQVLKDVQVKEWLSIKSKASIGRKRVYQVTFNFLPREAYKERFVVKPKQILAYMERVYLKTLLSLMRKKIKLMAKTRLLSHGTRARSEKTAEKESEDGAGTSHVDDDEDSDLDDNTDGDAGSKKEKNRHDQEHEYEDSDKDADVDDNTDGRTPDEDVEMDEGIEEDEEELGDLEENLIRQKETIHKDGRINAVLQMAPEIEKYNFDNKKNLWCTITLSFPLLESKFDVLSVIEEHVKKRVVYNIPGLDGCYLGEQKGPKGSELHLKTEGINVQEMTKHEGLLDLNRLYCNDIHQVADTFGIEAASKVIIKEIQNVFGAYGIYVDYRHLSLLADYMTFEGRYKPFNRMALSSNPSPLQKMTFETTMQFLTNASIQSHVDDLKSPSAQIVLGKNVSCGTGCLELLNPIASVKS